MEVYKLIKDTYDANAGTKFTKNNLGRYSYVNKYGVSVDVSHEVVSDTQWFVKTDEIDDYPVKWLDLKPVSGYRIKIDDHDETIFHYECDEQTVFNKNIFAYEHQADKCLALSELSQFAKQWNAIWLSKNEKNTVTCYTVEIFATTLGIEFTIVGISGIELKRYPVVFVSRELAKLSLKHHFDLWCSYYNLKPEEINKAG